RASFRSDLSFDLRGIEIKCAGVNVGKHRARAQNAGRRGRGYEAERGDDYFVAWPYPSGAQAEHQRIGARAYADAEASPAVARHSAASENFRGRSRPFAQD